VRLTTFEYAGRARPGALIGDEVVDLSSALGRDNATLLDILEAGGEGMERVTALVDAGAQRIALADVRLLAPVRPRKFFAIGLNYADHVAESGQQSPTNLTVFYKAPTCTAGPYDAIELPAVSTWLDYEGELGIVIGRRCRHVRAEDAPAVIAGYTVVNDVSVRDWQIMSPQWSLGKSFDTHGPIGPCIADVEEIGDPHALELRTYVNGELRQRSNTSNLIFSCFETVEILSQPCTLEPGDVIATGTPSGVAAGMDGRPWLVAGDRVRVEIDGIGAIENEVVPEDVAADFAADPAWIQGRGGVSA
jgi:2-keto-4-pentenoate hydratase/2-oxohepta-3-ene-1,7-dioic acid hydratase in catechol pathway